MCYTCRPVSLPIDAGCSVLLEREPDLYSLASDLGVDSVEEGCLMESGAAAVVLRVTLRVAASGAEVTECLHGVREHEGRPCALRDEGLVGRLLARVLASHPLVA